MINLHLRGKSRNWSRNVVLSSTFCDSMPKILKYLLYDLKGKLTSPLGDLWPTNFVYLYAKKHANKQKGCFFANFPRQEIGEHRSHDHEVCLVQRLWTRTKIRRIFSFLSAKYHITRWDSLELYSIFICKTFSEYCLTCQSTGKSPWWWILRRGRAPAACSLRWAPAQGFP